jgi:hypothetical protein
MSNKFCSSCDREYNISIYNALKGRCSKCSIKLPIPLVYLANQVLIDVNQRFPYLSPNIANNQAEFEKLYKKHGPENGVYGAQEASLRSNKFLRIRKNESKDKQYDDIVHKVFQNPPMHIRQYDFDGSEYRNFDYNLYELQQEEKEQRQNEVDERFRLRKLMINALTDNEINFFEGLLEKKSGERNIDALLTHELTYPGYGRYKTFHDIKLKRILEIREKGNTEEQLETALKYGIGNCNELAFYAFNRLSCLLTAHNHALIELVAFEAPADHVFIVLNRPNKSDISKWSSWGDETIIVDPWINAVYNSRDLFQIWQINPWKIHPNEFKIKFKRNNIM